MALRFLIHHNAMPESKGEGRMIRVTDAAADINLRLAHHGAPKPPFRVSHVLNSPEKGGLREEFTTSSMDEDRLSTDPY